MKAFTAAVLLALGVTVAAQEPVYKPGDKGVKGPVLVSEKKPVYTQAAREKKIQGAVFLEAIIDTEGKATNITVSKSLDKEYGLDESAIAALKEWRFKPGTKDGKPVSIQVTIEMTFRLRDGN